MAHATNVIEALKNHPGFARVIFSLRPFRRLDFSVSNTALAGRNLSDTKVFSSFVFDEMLTNNSCVGIGGYGENRVIYRQREHFGIEAAVARSIHLGTDIWTDAGQPVFCPLDGQIHSFAFNNNYGDYGPTIIIEHQLHGLNFFTLYGHLSINALDDLHSGRRIRSGEQIGELGNPSENGDWPPHLHFQIITDMGGRYGDFPGVSSKQEGAFYLSICPDPNLILRVDEHISR
jgi:peptidoglycan LD-endopeptidase LytH